MTQTWRLDHSIVLDNDGNPVAIIADPAGDGGEIEWPWVYDDGTWPPDRANVQAKANAALIIAAPDLLAALQDLMAVEGGEPNRPPPWMTEELLTPWLKAINAIGKATQEVQG